MDLILSSHFGDNLAGIHFKGLDDWFDPKSLLEGPIGNIKSAAKGDWEKALMPAGAGEAARPRHLIGYAKATFNPNYRYKFSEQRKDRPQEPQREAPRESRAQSLLEQAAMSQPNTSLKGKTLLGK